MHEFKQGDGPLIATGHFRKATVVPMRRMDEAFVCQSREGTLTGQAGDFVAEDGHGGFYPISAEFHTANYEEVTPAQDWPDSMTFSKALEAIKAGNRVARAGWNGKDMFVFLVPGSTFQVNRPPLMGIYPEGTVIDYHAHIDMRTADGQIVPWLASQTDMLADDWRVVT